MLWILVFSLLCAGTRDTLGSVGSAIRLVQGGGQLLIATVAASALLRVLVPAIFFDTGRVLLLALCGLVTIIPSDILLYLGANGLLPQPLFVASMLPFAAAPLLAGLLFGAAAATVIGLWASCACAVLFANSPAVLVTGALAAITSAYLAPRARRRTQVIRFGVIVALAEMAGVIVLCKGQACEATVMARQLWACIIGGVGSALLAVMILPVFEALFGVTSKITLMDLSDLGHPLLQRLAFEAPGTYHHSLMVASLAQAAADSVAANPILARVGAYYHDIGKLTKPTFFIENMRGSDSPHDSFSPSMSALIIISHVKEGLSLAMLHRLPRAIVDIIQQHHGTGLAAYFHHKAGRQASVCEQDLAQKSTPVTVDESPYRYPGPRPQGREATIIMLADAVEAASRSMEKPSPAHIGELVDRLISSRFDDGQLDSSRMTLSELARVKQAFVLCLVNMLHTRIAYPRS